MEEYEEPCPAPGDDAGARAAKPEEAHPNAAEEDDTAGSAELEEDSPGLVDEPGLSIVVEQPADEEAELHVSARKSRLSLLGQQLAMVAPRLTVSPAERALRAIKFSKSQGKGMRITYKNLAYSIPSQAKKESVFLLTGVTGFLLPGELTALMGPSGSGKTTLLDILAGRKTQGAVEGSILFAGSKPSKVFLRRFTGYVEQYDTLVDTLTVMEMLLYTAELKRPLDEKLHVKMARATELVALLGLAPCKDTRIGNAIMRGISGGQAKRVNIGIALITNPRVLFLDEPTSGLDSATSYQVMRLVHGLSEDGMTVCTTIHSPSEKIFRLFDKLTLLQHGRLIYSGISGEAAVEYFRPFAAVLTTPIDDLEVNTAEWIVDLIAQAEVEQRAGELVAAYDASPQAAEVAARVAKFERSRSTMGAAMLRDLAIGDATVTPFWFGFATFIKYRTAADLTSPMWIILRVASWVVTTVLLLTLYWGVGANNAPTNLINVSAILFYWAMMPSFGAATWIPGLFLERPLFIREINDGLYRPITYLCAKAATECVMVVINSLIWPTLIFFSVQLKGQWIVFFLVSTVALATAVMLAYVFAAAMPSMEAANSLMPIYASTLLFVAGFLLRTADIPVYWRWYTWLNYARYGWGALMVDQFVGKSLQLSPGVEILSYYSLDHLSKWAWLGYQSLFFCFLFFLTWLALSFCQHSKR